MNDLTQEMRLFGANLGGEIDAWTCWAANAIESSITPEWVDDTGAWALETMGPGRRTAALCEHIRRELVEIEADPTDLTEWCDVLLLAFDGARRAGYDGAEILAELRAKQSRNCARRWPDWRMVDPGAPIEHLREADQSTIAPGDDQ